MLTKQKNLTFGISNKQDGSMKLLGNKADKVILKNRRKYFSKLNINLEDVVWSDLAASKVKAVSQKDGGKIIKEADALVTNEKNIFLAITVADCLPVYVIALRQPALRMRDMRIKLSYGKPYVMGLAHMGWREVLKNAAGKAIKLMKIKYGTEFKNISVFIGPHVQKCHFEIKKDVLRRFIKYKDFIIKRQGRMFIDLSKIVKYQLLACGLKGKNIKISKECTYCLKSKYFSYRRGKAKDIQAMTAFIGVK